MRKLLFIICVCAIMLSLMACAADDKTIQSNSDNESRYMLGKSAMIEIGDGLWYDSTTRIVYWWNGCLASGYQSATTPSPYYASNGLPYRFDPENNRFEVCEIS